jgi:hypothetical protein
VTDHATAAPKRSAALKLWALNVPTLAIAHKVGFASTNMLRDVISRARASGDKRAVWRASGRPRARVEG